MKMLIALLALAVLVGACPADKPSDVPAMIEASRSSVVRVIALLSGSDNKMEPRLVGTGFVVGPGMAATAYHVVKDHQHVSYLLVPSSEEQADSRHVAKVIAFDPNHDLALLQCPALNSVKPLSLHESAGSVKVGEDALVLGFPLSDATLTATKGMIAAQRKAGIRADDPNAVTDLIKLDASVNAGNSGGPVIHLPTGKVIGVVHAKLGGPSKMLKEFAEEEQRGASVRIAGDDPIKLLKETVEDMERNLNLGLGYAISVEHLEALIEKVKGDRVDRRTDEGK